MPAGELDARLARVAHILAQGDGDGAFALATETAERYPSSSAAITNLGYFYVQRGDPARARDFYVQALALDRANGEAQRGLAVACTQLGEPVPPTHAVVRTPFEGEGRAVELLVLVTLGSGNVVLERLLDPRRFAVTRLAVELFDERENLPAHDVVFNAIGEADAAEAALMRAERLLRKAHSRVLNDPRAVRSTGRARVARRLAGIAGLVVPAVEIVGRSEFDSRRWSFPVLLRAPGFHTGEHFIRVDAPAQLPGALASVPGDPLFAIEYVDVADGDGIFAKYRMMAIGGELYPLHAAFGTNWKLHYYSSDMNARADLREREAAFLRDPVAVLGENAYDALLAIVAEIGLDYMGIDFALDRDGAVVLFEANATMAIRRGEGAERILERWGALVGGD